MFSVTLKKVALRLEVGATNLYMIQGGFREVAEGLKGIAGVVSLIARDLGTYADELAEEEHRERR